MGSMAGRYFPCRGVPVLWRRVRTKSPCREAGPMLIRKPPDLCACEITPREVYLSRRTLLAGAAGLLGVGTMPGAALAEALAASKSPLSTDEKITSLKDVTSYNNYYEFGVDKDDPAANAHTLTTKPWTVKIDGLAGKPADYALEDLVKP